ncbi:MAG: lysophospholipid acyltransferase family protein [Burkholderiales bacterium]|nr:lysophospholipid acyltransferase family protein [Burkholderiales bacterium]
MMVLFRILSWLPLWVLHGIGWGLGWLVFALSPTYRRRFLANCAQAGLTWRQCRGAVGQAGQLVAELPRLWFGRPVPVTWEGGEHVLQALTAGRAIVFLTPHMGSFEVTAQDYAVRFGAMQPITVLFRPSRQPALRTLVATARQRPHLQTAPTTLAGVKQLIKALRQGQSVGLLPDQVPPQGLGVWAPFYGREAYTMTLSARLAQQTGAVVLLAWGERLPRGRGYTVHVQPLGTSLPSDPQAAATVINQAMEQVIATCPQQYLWAYARYKQPREEGL